MKKIPKKSLDALLTMTRKYWETGDMDVLSAKYALSEKLKKETGVDWLAFLDLANSILKPSGFKRKASNVTIYAVLNVLGYEVVDDEIQESESL